MRKREEARREVARRKDEEEQERERQEEGRLSHFMHACGASTLFVEKERLRIEEEKRKEQEEYEKMKAMFSVEESGAAVDEASLEVCLFAPQDQPICHAWMHRVSRCWRSSSTLSRQRKLCRWRTWPRAST